MSQTSASFIEEYPDITLLKSALEFARFDNPDIRVDVYSVIDGLNEDLVSLGYEPSTKVKDLLRELEETINEAEDDGSEDNDDDDDDEDLDEDNDEDED